MKSRRSRSVAGRTICVWALCVMACLVDAARARGQCGASLVSRYGGETTAVEQVNPGLLMLAHGTVLDLVSISNPAAPSYLIFVSARMTLDAPAVKISIAAGGTRAYVLQQDESVLVVNVSGIGMTRLDRVEGTFIDVLADGNRFYTLEEDHGILFGQGPLRVYDTATSPPTQLSQTIPTQSPYEYDRMVKVGNVVWAGFHQFQSVNLGVDGLDMTNPAAPVRVATRLTTANVSTYTAISAMAAIGNNVFVTYKNNDGSFAIQDWLRAVNVSSPSTPAWRAPVDLNSDAEAISVVGNQLHVAVGGAGVSVWDASNAAAPVWLGTYHVAGSLAHDVRSISGTDYVAAGPLGLEIMGTTNPAAASVTGTLAPLPGNAAVVRQYSTTTAVLDPGTSTLRLFNYTLAAAQQARGSVPVAAGSSMMELVVLPGGVYASVISGSTMQTVNITNPDAPVSVSTTNLGALASRMCVSSSRLYVMLLDEVKTYNMNNPAAPGLLGSATYGDLVQGFDMAAFGSTLAIGTYSQGVWFLDMTSPASPVVRSIWNTGDGYSVTSVCKGPTNLYVAAYGLTGPFAPPSHYRIDVLDVSNVDFPALAWRVDRSTGGEPGPLYHLDYVQNSTNKFLIGMDQTGIGNPMTTLLSFFDVSNQQVPVPIAKLETWNIRDRVAGNSDGTRIFAGAADSGVYEIGLPTQWAPGFVALPQDRHACLGANALFGLTFPPVSANPSSVTYRWYRGNAPLSDGPTAWGSSYSGTTGIFFTVSSVRKRDLGTGYKCVATNSCGSTTSLYAQLIVCTADFNCSGTLSVQDIFDFLNAWFAGSSLADYNGFNGLAVQDIFDFLNDWFAGCS